MYREGLWFSPEVWGPQGCVLRGDDLTKMRSIHVARALSVKACRSVRGGHALEGKTRKEVRTAAVKISHLGLLGGEGEKE